jgi:Peptidase family C54
VFLERGEEGGRAAGASGRSPTGLLVLLPLTLGIGRVNPRYLPQLQAVLAFPHSVGIVGGRPGSSLYFVGCQDEHVIYLDPHEVQEVGSKAVPDATEMLRTRLVLCGVHGKSAMLGPPRLAAVHRVLCAVSERADRPHSLNSAMPHDLGGIRNAALSV